MNTSNRNHRFAGQVTPNLSYVTFAVAEVGATVQLLAFFSLLKPSFDRQKKVLLGFSVAKVS